MKNEDKKALIEYLKNNKANVAKYFNKSPQNLEDFINLLESELIKKNIRVIYFTECVVINNGGRAGKQLERLYESLDEALATPLPKGCVSGCIFAEEGTYYFNSQYGWEFYKENN